MPCHDTCTLGCYGEGLRCVKPTLKPEVKSVPEKPTAYILEMSRSLDDYDNYTEIFEVDIVDSAKAEEATLDDMLAATMAKDEASPDAADSYFEVKFTK